MRTFGEQDHLIPFAHRRVEPVTRADVLAVEVDVHEGGKLTVLEQLRAERRIALDEIVDNFGHGVAAGLE